MKKSFWKKHLEHHSQSHTLGGQGEAIARFKKLTYVEQWKLTEEVIEARIREYCLAFSNVISVYPGYKTRRSNTKAGISISRQLCVVFVVKRKWRSNQGREPQRIPTHVFTYAGDVKNRFLYGIPTDVIPASEHVGAELQFDTRVKSTETNRRNRGTITCGIIVRNGRDRTHYLLSCRHFMALTKEEHPNKNIGGEITYNGSWLGRVSGKIGKFRELPDYSLDAQLARPSSDNLFDEIVRSKNLNGVWARGWTEVPDTCYVQTSRGRVRVKKLGLLREPLHYKDAGWRLHKSLIKSLIAPGQMTRGGDSGSPVTTARHGGKLVGMHIAKRDSSQRKYSFIVPAWLLLSPDSYERTTSSETWLIA